MTPGMYDDIFSLLFWCRIMSISLATFWKLGCHLRVRLWSCLVLLLLRTVSGLRIPRTCFLHLQWEARSLINVPQISTHFREPPWEELTPLAGWVWWGVSRPLNNYHHGEGMPFAVSFYFLVHYVSNMFCCHLPLCHTTIARDPLGTSDLGLEPPEQWTQINLLSLSVTCLKHFAIIIQIWLTQEPLYYQVYWLFYKSLIGMSG